MSQTKAFDLAEKLSVDLMAATTKLDMSYAETSGAREECERLKQVFQRTVVTLSKDLAKLRREALEPARVPAEDTEALRLRIADLVQSEALAWAAGKETTEALARMIKERDSHRSRAEKAEARVAELEAEGTARCESGSHESAGGPVAWLVSDIRYTAIGDK